jgi:hypothetical protein
MSGTRHFVTHPSAKDDARINGRRDEPCGWITHDLEDKCDINDVAGEGVFIREDTYSNDNNYTHE